MTSHPARSSHRPTRMRAAIVITVVLLALSATAMADSSAPSALATPARTAAAAAPDPDSPPLTYFGPARQLISVVVDSDTATTGTLTAWERTGSAWRSVIGPVRAFVGAAGVGQASENSTETPAGVWSLGEAFGRQPNPGTAMPYFKTDSYDWWNGNSNSPQYNTHVRQAGSPGASENLYNIGPVYDYAIDIGYNRARTPGAGSAFFLHVTDGRPTGGCVAVDRAVMISILQWLDPGKAPVIDIGTAPAGSRDPIGHFDSAQLSGDSVHVSGWALDPDRLQAPIAIHAYDTRPDGTEYAIGAAADLGRPDVAEALPGAGPNHGFDTWLGLRGPGRHRVCVYAINADRGTTNPTLGCFAVDIPAPVGYYDSLAVTAPRTITLSGWGADPVAPGDALQVTVSVTGPGGRVDPPAMTTGLPRPDVGAAYLWAGGRQGFAETVAAQGAGPHQVCVSLTPAHYPPAAIGLGCRTVDVRDAFGYLDGATAAAGTITATGWAMNPNNPAERVEIHVYDTGPTGTRGYPGVIADRSRPDVARAYTGYDGNHGYVATIPADPGAHRICTFAITTGGGYTNPMLGCRDVTVG